MHNYKELKIWQESIELTARVYDLTRTFPKEEMFNLTSQLRRAVVSVSSNIAEGAYRGDNEFQHFLNVSGGSIAEVETQLIIARRLNYLSKEDFEELEQWISRIQKMNFQLKKKMWKSW